MDWAGGEGWAKGGWGGLRSESFFSATANDLGSLPSVNGPRFRFGANIPATRRPRSTSFYTDHKPVPWMSPQTNTPAQVSNLEPPKMTRILGGTSMPLTQPLRPERGRRTPWPLICFAGTCLVYDAMRAPVMAAGDASFVSYLQNFNWF